MIPEWLQTECDRHPYPLVFATVSGAHLYGFASQDSDWDLRGMHVLPAAELLGLGPARETIEVSAMRGPDELDLVTHDARKFITMMLRPNGYVLEQLLSPLVVRTSPEHRELCGLASRCLTRRHAAHYLGFARSRWRMLENEDPPRVKTVLYLYRVLLTGIHLMRTGEVEANLERLNAEARIGIVDELIAEKRERGEKGALADRLLEPHRKQREQLETKLQAEAERSPLPELASAQPELNALLLRLRGLRGFDVPPG